MELFGIPKVSLNFLDLTENLFEKFQFEDIGLHKFFPLMYLKAFP